MRIRRIQLGVTSNFLIKCDDYGYVLVDAGEPGLSHKFQRVISKWGIMPADIRLLIVTHAHYDHVGSLAAIKNWCGCPVLIHPLEAAIMEQAQVVIPPGTNCLGKAFSCGGQVLKPFMRFPSARADILVSDHYDLHQFGIAGRVIATPGHTEGSLSVILASGEAMVGDLAMNFAFTRSFPIFAEDAEKLKVSRQMIRDIGVKWVYPAHGKSFSISVLS